MTYPEAEHIIGAILIALGSASVYYFQDAGAKLFAFMFILTGAAAMLGGEKKPKIK